MRKILSYVFGYKYPHPVEKAFSKLTRYHYYFFAWLFLIKIPLFWRMQSLLFLTPKTHYICTDATKQAVASAAGNITINGTLTIPILLDSCPCDNPKWDTSVFTKTLQSKFNLICEKDMWVTAIQSILAVGCLFGSFFFGFLSDRFGRLLTLMITTLIICLTGLANSFMPNLYGYFIVRLIEGFGLGGSIVVSFVFCVEFCGPPNREMIVALYHIPINVGHLSLAGVSYIWRDCDHYQLAMTLPLFIFLLMQFLTVESPKWLMDRNRIDDAVRAMTRIGNFNKKPFENMRFDMEAYQAAKAGAGETRLKFTKIFKYGHLTRNFFCMAVNYFSCGAGYYGVSHFISKMSGDIHLNVALNGSLLIPGTLVATFLLPRLGRRPFLMWTNILSGISILLCIVIPKSVRWEMVRVIIACLCNVFFFMAFIVVFLYGVELFPTSIRNAVLGVLCILSRLGTIVGPFINRASEVASGLTFGIIAIVAGILCIPLPETKGTELPTTLEDIQKKNPKSPSQSKGAASTSSAGSSKKSKNTTPSPKKKDTTPTPKKKDTTPPPKKKDTGSGSFFSSGSSSPKK